VAAWLSEKVLRGRGPDASGFESHRRGRIFSKEGTSAGPWRCVYVSSGLTVGWWKEESTLFRPPPRGQHGFESRSNPVGKRRPWVYKCCIVYVCECEVEWAWVAGENAPEPRRIT
jgi:hypothetical protein